MLEIGRCSLYHFLGLLLPLRAFCGTLGEYTVKITDLEKTFTKNDSEPENGRVWHHVLLLIPSKRIISN